jgi:hypothetical protein
MRADALRTLDKLNNIDVPPRDLPALVARLKLRSKTPLPLITDKKPGEYKVGHAEPFFLHDIAAKNYYSITAKVEIVSEHAYWYVAEGERVDRAALQDAAELFEAKIYPTNARVFGTEWNPGVDNDMRITVLLADIPNVGGYYSSADEYTRAVNPFSNEREIIYINIGAGWNSFADTLAHEHQHMIHWHASPNHDVWLNEGSSVMAETLSGFNDVGVDGSFMSDPDIQLNAWRSSPGESLRHYGAAYLFVEYLRSHYGGDRILRALVSAGGQGTDAVDAALQETGHKVTFADVFQKWTIANLLDDEAIAPTDLTYPNREVQIQMNARVSRFPQSIKGSVAQFGADYFEISPPPGGGRVTVEFTGSPYVGVVDTAAHSGNRFWWSNRGDVSNTHMTRSFDLRGIRQATLEYDIWYDVEEGFDYGYVEVSTDSGVTWDTLKGKYTTTENPNGTNLGNAYTGKSREREGADPRGWLHETLDIAPYAGQEIVLRFEYVTDDGYNAQGLAVDNISIAETGYTDDAEGASNWQAVGFAHISDDLPQQYHVAAVLFGDSEPQVVPITVDAESKATFTLEEMGSRYESAVLVVSGLTPHTLQSADYTLQLTSDK